MSNPNDIAWAVVRNIQSNEVVHKVKTRRGTIDRAISGLLINMDTERFYVDEWHKKPERGEKDANGKLRKLP